MNTLSQIWDHSNETVDRETMQQLQLERLQATVFRAYRNVAFYRKRFDALGLVPEDIQSLNDLVKLPFTTREDLRSGYPYDMLAVPLREVVRLHSFSWSTGRPIVCAFTRNDLRHWIECNARLLAAAGVTRDDVALIIFSERKLDSGMALHGGAERIGASVIPTTPGDSSRQLTIMQDFKTTVLAGMPNDGARLLNALAQGQLDPRRLSLRIGLFGAEPWSEKLRADLTSGLGIQTRDCYDLSEFGGPGIAGECEQQQGLHLAEDHYLAEIIDPVSGQPLPHGEQGELVLTSLTKEALPLLRFRTHDITSINAIPCACGRTLARMARISKRTDGLLFAQGISFNPARIADLLQQIEGTAPQILLTISRQTGEDELELMVEVAFIMHADSVGKLLAIEQRIAQTIRQTLGLNIKVRLVEAQTIEKISGGEALKVIDKRE